MIFSFLTVRFGIKFCRSISHTISNGQKCSKSAKRLEPPWKILFFGNDNFALESLKPLNAKLKTGTLVSDVGVVTGQRTAVRNFCLNEKLSILEWPLDLSLIIDKYHVGMVVSFGHMIPKDVIEVFPLGCINVHSSILPKYRGAAPIIHSVMNGDSETGVTIMKIHPNRFDVGEIVRQYRLSVSPSETSVELERRLAVCGSLMLMECLRDLPRSIQMAIPQPIVGVSYAPKIKSTMAKVDWNNKSAAQIYNLHRAVGHIHPLCTSWHGVPVKLLDVVVETRMNSPSTEAVSVGDTAVRKSALDFLNDSVDKCYNSEISNGGQVEYFKYEKVLKVSCKDGAKIVVRRLTICGKTISASDFFNGYLTKRPVEEWTFG